MAQPPHPRVQQLARPATLARRWTADHHSPSEADLPTAAASDPLPPQTDMHPAQRLANRSAECPVQLDGPVGEDDYGTEETRIPASEWKKWLDALPPLRVATRRPRRQVKFAEPHPAVPASSASASSSSVSSSPMLAEHSPTSAVVQMAPLPALPLSSPIAANSIEAMQVYGPDTQTALSLPRPSELSSADTTASDSSVIPVAIDAVLASREMLVAMMDRPLEMRELFTANPEYFALVQRVLRYSPPSPHTAVMLEDTGEDVEAEDAYDRLLRVLFCPRHELPDRVWVRTVGELLTPGAAPLFEKFKDMVGYVDQEDWQTYYHSDSDSDNASGRDGPAGKEMAGQLPSYVVKPSDSADGLLVQYPTGSDTCPALQLEQVPLDEVELGQTPHRRRSSSITMADFPHLSTVVEAVEPPSSAATSNMHNDCNTADAGSIRSMSSYADSLDDLPVHSSPFPIAELSELPTDSPPIAGDSERIADLIRRLRDRPHLVYQLPVTQSYYFCQLRRILREEPKDTPYADVVEDCDAGYDMLMEVLRMPRAELDDEAWRDSLEETLEGFPGQWEAFLQTLRRQVSRAPSDLAPEDTES